MAVLYLDAHYLVEQYYHCHCAPWTHLFVEVQNEEDWYSSVYHDHFVSCCDYETGSFGHGHARAIDPYLYFSALYVHFSGDWMTHHAVSSPHYLVHDLFRSHAGSGSGFGYDVYQNAPRVFGYDVYQNAPRVCHIPPL